MQLKEKIIEDTSFPEQQGVAMPQTLAGISHELCAPMSGLLEMSALLLDTDLTEHQRQLAQTVNLCGRNLRAIIENAIQSSKVDETEFELKPEPFDLRTLLHGIVLKQIPAARIAAIDIDISYPDHLPTRFIGDSEKLARVLNHLLGNAVKSAQETTIMMLVNGQLGADDKFHLYLAVKDSGAGIAPEEAEAIFTAPNANLPTGDLCLSMARKVIEHMGGNLKVISQKGRGCVFYINIVLPLVKSVQHMPAFESPVN